MSRKTGICFICCLFLLTLSVRSDPAGPPYAGKKIIYIDSYHQGYAWSDGIFKGIQEVLAPSGAELLVYHMDTKRNTSESYCRQSALKAKAVIESFGPDVIITSDDNAFKYVIMPYYRDSKIPVVFCGLNWDASLYGAPYSNTTGMIEVALIPELISILRQYAAGSRVGHIAADVTTARKEGEYYKKLFDIDLTEQYVSSFAEWKENFIDIQNKVDILIVGNTAGINDFDGREAEQFVQEHTVVPTGTIYDFMIDYALIGFVKIEEEQGTWAAETALKILGGKSPRDIPLTQNDEGLLMVNLRIADTLNIVFSPHILRNAEIVE